MRGGKDMNRDIQAPTAGHSRNRWLVGGSALAAAAASLALVPGAARAQAAPNTTTPGSSVNASANYNSEAIIYSPGSVGDTVQVQTASAIINWTTNDAGTASGPVTFLDSGNQLTFTSSFGDYTVLNRIFTPTVDAPVLIDGTVESYVGEAFGGNLWFYSPGGLVIGGNSSFNVGGLVLTSSDLNAIGSTIDFTGVTTTDSAVIIEAGAQISATQQNSYFAVVAPRVEQGGTADVNGSVAYVAAEQAQLTINNGLFDISVDVGSAATNGVTHTGTTTGAAAEGSARGIYMVAVPKNAAIGMLVGGTIGYQPATSASTSPNGSIILSAGTGTVVGGSAEVPTGQPDIGNSVSGGTVRLGDVTFTSGTGIYASDGITLQDAGVVNVEGDLAIKSSDTINVDLTSTSGSVSVGGNFEISAAARGVDDFGVTQNNGGTGIGTDAAAGSINFTVGGATVLDVGGNLLLDASAQGGLGDNQSGASTAGDITANFNTTGTVTVGGVLDISARAIAAQEGKDTSPDISRIGNSSTAGNAVLGLGGASVTAGQLTVNASADASSGNDATVEQQNNSAAGMIQMDVTGGTHGFGAMELISQSNSAQSFDAAGTSLRGEAGRGSIALDVTNADTRLNVGDFLLLDATTDGVTAAPVGNTVSLSVNNVGPDGGIFVGGSLRVETTAGGGVGTGVTTAGSVLVDVTDGLISTSSFDVYAFASQGGRSFSSLGTGRNFQGGDVTLRANSGGRIAANFAFVASDAIGADGTGGNAIGGNIALIANDGEIAFDSFSSLVASATGGTGLGPDGLATTVLGGEVIASVLGANGSLDLGFSFANTDAYIGGGSFSDFSSASLGPSALMAGDGGQALAGNVTFNIDGGTFAAENLSVSSVGGGGGGSAPSVTASTGFPPAAEGGLGQGGQITFNLDGGAAVMGSMTLIADGIGGDGATGYFDAGTSGGRGGDAVGGSVVFNALSGSLETTGLYISAQGNTVESGGRGGSGFGSEGGAGGNAMGGSATFNLVGSAAITADNVTITTDAFGGRGGDSIESSGQNGPLPAVAAGAGGAGTGGTSIFNHDSGSITFTTLSATAQGTGGSGGSSGSIFSSSGSPTSDAGAGGAGFGGSATITLGQDVDTGPSYRISADAFGGSGGSGLNSGDGGAATGGSANLEIDNAAVSLSVATISAFAEGGNAGSTNSAGGIAGSGGDAIGGTAGVTVTGAASSLTVANHLDLFADASGGQGADGEPSSSSGAAGGVGGSGGNAFGGTAAIELIGAGTALTINAAVADFAVNAIGGQGGLGGGSFDGTAGAGGQGGDATGGFIALIANSGTTLTLDGGTEAYVLESLGTGGSGGQGGSADSSGGGSAGTGGNGGTGIGGSPSLLAIGGTITGGDVTLIGSGIGGTGGAAAEGSSAGIAGNGGNAQGGTPTLELQDGSPGIITLGNVNILSAGTAGTGELAGSTIGGRVDLNDLSTEAGGIFTFNSLAVTVDGDIASTGGGFFFNSDSGTNTILGDQTIDVVGDIAYTFVGNGRLNVGGSTQLSATGDILIGHTDSSGAIVSFANGGNFIAAAGGDFIADGQSIIGSGADLLVRAEGNAEANDLRAVANIDLSAGQNVTLGNASVTGAPQILSAGSGFLITNGVNVRAGGDNQSGVESFDPAYSVTVLGDVTSTAQIDIVAGGSALFAAGSSTVSNNGLNVVTGDDIIIQSGALVEAGANLAGSINPASPFLGSLNLTLDAGGLVRSEQLAGAPASPIASIISTGTIETNDTAAILLAHAIDGTGGTINAGSLRADIFTAIDVGSVPRDDDGLLLNAACLEGSICLGTIAVDNRLEIGQISDDVIRLTLGQGTVTASDVLITTQEDIVIGGVAGTTFNSANVFALDSLNGNVDLNDTAIISGEITIAAAGSLLGNASLISTGDIGITVGQDLSANLIDAGGQLTDAANVGGALETEFSVPGAIDVTTYAQGAGAPVTIIAGGDNRFGAITLDVAGNITLEAGGDVFLGALFGADAVQLTGVNVGYGDLTAAQSVTIDALDGDVSGGSISAAGSLTMDAAGSINTGELAAGGSGISLGAGLEIVIGDVSTTGAGASVVLDAGGAITAAEINSAASVGLTGGDTVSATDILAVGGIDISGINGIAVGSLTGSSAQLEAIDGAVVVANDIDVSGLVTADGRSLFLRSSNGLTVAGTASSGGIDILTVGDLTLQGLTASANVDVTSTSGSIFVNAPVSSGGGIQPVGVQGPLQLISSGGDVNVRAAEDFVVNSEVSAAKALTVEVGGLVDLQAGASGATIDALMGDITIGEDGSLGRYDVTQSIQITTAGNIVLGGAGGGSATAGTLTLDNDEFSRISSGGDLSIIALLGSSGGGNITLDTLDARAGSGSQSGTIGAEGSLLVKASGAIEVVGGASLSNAGDNTVFGLNAAEAIRVSTESGALLVRDGGDQLAGSLELTAPRIEAISDLARSDIANAGTAAINTRLGQNDGEVNDMGYIGAANLTFTVDDALLIQNSGDGTELADRRGFTGDSVTINSDGSTTMIVINGIVDTLTGADAIAALGLPSSFDPGSTVNGCLILNAPNCGSIPHESPDHGFVYPVQDLIDWAINPSDSLTPPVEDDIFIRMVSEMRKSALMRDDPLLDEPVTGAGNEDLWISELDCEGADKDSQACLAGNPPEGAE